MTNIVEKFQISTKGFSDVIDITSKVQDIVSFSNFEKGLVNVCVISSCASILTMENQQTIAYDIAKLLDDYVPVNKVYQYDNAWHEGNAFAHIKASILSNNLTLPIINNKVQLAPFAQITLIDFDNKASNLEIVVTVIS